MSDVSPDRQALEALKSLGKALGQMSLYKIGHPAVAATLDQAEGHLTEALAQTQGELSFSVDHEKLLANGRIIGKVGDLPNAVAAVFSRFKLSSMTFKAGVGRLELNAFCELTAPRPGGGAPPDAVSFMAERGVTRISFNEAVYAKLDGEGKPVEGAVAAGGVQAQQGAGAGAGEGGAPQPVAQAIMAAPTLDKTIEVLVEKAVPEPGQRGQIMGRVMDLLREDIERRVAEVAQELRREKAVLQNEQARTSSVLSSMVEGVVMVDEQGKILMMNPAAEQLYGTTLAEAAGLPLAAKAGEEHVVTIANEILPPAAPPTSADVTVTAQDETRRTIKASGAVVQNQEGKVVGMVSQLSDVAKHKEMQRMQRDFIAHVTHELRAPLSSIRAALEILQSEVAEKMKEEEHRILQTALKNSDRLGDLINSILDFSKIESGQMTVFPKKQEAERIARDGVDSLAAWAAKKRVSLSLVTAQDLPIVSADPQRTVQVIVNLISNAIKFTPVGGAITVRVQNSPEKIAGDQFVQFSVSDTGPGIPKKEQKRIFEKFVQIASGEQHVGGTGLGLAIAKALIHMQGGKMWVESEEGQGATFVFTLPVYTAARETTPAAEVKKAPLPWWKRLLGLKA